MTSLQSQTALVTGGSRGIGRAIAVQLAKDGFRVAATATSASGVAAIERDFAALGLAVYPVALDVCNVADCAAVLGQVEAKLGPVTVLVNNAGITRDQLAMRMKEEEWDAVIATNLTAVGRMSRLVLRGMLKARMGRIINITSVSGAFGNPGQSNYAAAKSGVEGMARSLAREVGSRGITVNCVAPGFIDTDMTQVLPEAQRAAILSQVPLGRLGAPEEIAAVVAFLASPSAAYITGQTIHVNGGMYCN